MARRGKFGKAALLMGAAAVAAGVLLKRDKVAGLLGQGRQETQPSWTPAPAPAPANYDAPGPPANTATPVPAPEPFVREEGGSIDEAAEEAAAAAEAANIGGQVSDYAGPELGEPATPEERPLAEAGEGESEGQEQAEAELREAAEPTAPGMSPEQAQIEESIAQTENQELIEPASPPDDSEWQTWSGRAIEP
jgi:hypothetical protein